MNIILVSGNLNRTRTVTLTGWHLAAGGVVLAAAVIGLAVAIQYFVLRYAAAVNIPALNSLILSLSREQHERRETYLRENLNALAVKLGEMQAQLLRLDTLGDRLAKSAGFKPQELMFGEVPGRGGAVSTLPTYDLSLSEVARQVDQLGKAVEEKSEKLGVLTSVFSFDSARKKLLPSVLPVEGGWYSSNFGYRIDPFTGGRAFHEGIDFMAEVGTPVIAAAGGVVVYSDYHPQYGNMIEIDHGGDLVTRYAHAQRRLVKVGDVVLRGTRIAEVGNTGRSTGTHLHFEVRHRGSPQNPARFLRLPG